MISIQGIFESHLTIHAETPAILARFQAVCAEIGVKCLHIELDSGTNASQPMLRAIHCGDLAFACGEARELEALLRERGFAVTRVKVEAFIGNAGVPVTDAVSETMPRENYFEFHALVALPTEIIPEALRSICRTFGGHLSRNALKRDDAGRTLRFVTMRVADVGSARASARFDELLRALRDKGFELSKIQREYVVFDSNFTLDEGWAEVLSGKKVDS